MGGSLTKKELEAILFRFPYYRNLVKPFVETGTWKGESARTASGYFSKVHTIEIVEELYLESKKLGAGIENIEYHLGDSLKVLEKLENVPTFYFIDAHQSGTDTGNNGIEVPLLMELEIILRKNRNPCIFVFDDVRLFDIFSDWKGISLNSIISKFKDPIKHCYVENDRFVVYVN